MCTSLSAEEKDEQDEPLRAKNRCAVDENDCDLQVATSRRPAFERAQRGIKNADSSVVGDPRAEIFIGARGFRGETPRSIIIMRKLMRRVGRRKI